MSSGVKHDSPMYAVSKYLVSILSPLRKNTNTVKNSSDLVQELKQYLIANDGVFCRVNVWCLLMLSPYLPPFLWI